MDFNIQTIVKEWNRILGKNPKASKQSHIRELGMYLLDRNYPQQFVDELYENLILRELDFDDADSFKAYAAKHKVRPTTTIKIGGKSMTAGEADPSLAKKDDDKKSKSKPSIYEKPNTVAGDPKKGDNKIKNEMLEHGYNGIEDALGKKPAPGNPGSAFNEIVSGEGIHMLDESPNMSEQELAQKMFDQFGGSGLGLEQTQASGIPKEDYPPHINENLDKAKTTQKEYLEKVLGKKPSKKKEPKAYKEYEEKLKTLKKNDPPTEDGNQFQQNQKAINKAEKDKAIMSKCIIAARSSKEKHSRSTKRTENLQEKGVLGKNTKTNTFYGADDSIQAQVNIIEKSNKVLLPNGKEVSKQDAIDFVKAGGGGVNPSDTATFVTDDKGNLMLQFHSDKMSTADIQDNSTLVKEGENYKGYVEKTEGLTSEQKEKATGVINKYSEEMEKIEQNYNDQATPIAQRLKELPIEEQVDVIEKDKGTLKKNLKTALRAADGGVKKQYEEYMPEGKTKFDELSTQEQYEIIRKITSDGKGKANDTKIINKVASAVEKQNPGIEGLDVKKNLSEQRKKVVDLQKKRVAELNETKVSIDGVEKGLGEMMEADESIRAFHLDLMNDNDYDENDPNQNNRFKGIMDSAFDVNMGGSIVTGEVLRNCIGVKNTTEMKQKFVLQEAQGKDKKGRDARFTYDDNDNITGKKVFVYAVDSEGKQTEIGFKTYRSKAGADGKTNNTMTYSKGMQNCFKTGEKP